MTRFIALVLLSVFSGGGPADADAPFPSSSTVYAALPSLDGARLTAFQAGIFTRTQRELIERNPRRISTVEGLLTKFNLCFRQVAKASVEARYWEVVEQLSAEERQAVLAHLRGSIAAKLLAFHEGTYPRLELASDELVQLKANGPAIDRFHELVRFKLRGIRLSQPGPACQNEMAQEFTANGLSFVPLPLRPWLRGVGAEEGGQSHYGERADRPAIDEEPRPIRSSVRLRADRGILP